MRDDEAVRAALETIFDADTGIYRERGFQRRVGSGRGRRSSTSTSRTPGRAPAMRSRATGWRRSSRPSRRSTTRAAQRASRWSTRRPRTRTSTARTRTWALWVHKIPVEHLEGRHRGRRDRQPHRTGEGELRDREEARERLPRDAAVELPQCPGGRHRDPHGRDDGRVRPAHGRGRDRSSGFRPIVVREAVGDRVPGVVEWNLFDIDAKFGDVEPLEDVLAYLDGIETFTSRSGGDRGQADEHDSSSSAPQGDDLQGSAPPQAGIKPQDRLLPDPAGEQGLRSPTVSTEGSHRWQPDPATWSREALAAAADRRTSTRSTRWTSTAMLAHFADDATLTVQTDHVTFDGADEIRRMFTDFFAASKSIRHEIRNMVVEEAAGKVSTEQGYIGELERRHEERHAQLQLLRLRRRREVQPRDHLDGGDEPAALTRPRLSERRRPTAPLEELGHDPDRVLRALDEVGVPDVGELDERDVARSAPPSSGRRGRTARGRAGRGCRESRSSSAAAARSAGRAARGPSAPSRGTPGAPCTGR